MRDDVRIFIGSSNQNLVEQGVLVGSLVEYVRPENIYCFNVNTGTVTNLYREVIAHISIPRKVTNFSWFRFYIPKICNFSGISIYLDSDIVCLQNPLDLIPAEIKDHHFCAVPIKDAIVGGLYSRLLKSNTFGAMKSSYLLSVMILNNAKWESLTGEYLQSIVESGKYKYTDVMFMSEKVRKDLNIKAFDLSGYWNCLDLLKDKTIFVHFTELITQPWKNPFNLAGRFWEKKYLEACELGFIRNVDIEIALQEKGICYRIAQMPFLARRGLKGRVALALWKIWDSIKSAPKIVLFYLYSRIKIK